MMLEIRNVSKKLGELRLSDITMNVEAGDYFVLLGESGVGKTVLLEMLAGLMRPDAGSVMLDGKDITNEKIQNRPLALVYQDQMLFPHMTVRDNINYAPHARGAGRKEINELTCRLAAEVGAEHILDRMPGALSGGEAQRVALARALAAEPRVMLLDEPLSSIDTPARADIRTLLKTLNRSGHTMLHVTHDYEEAVSLASHVAIMEGGRISQTGTPEDVFGNPKTKFAAKFAGVKNLVKGEIEKTPGCDGFSFVSISGLTMSVLTDSEPGPGHLAIRSEDIILSSGRTETSARNCFEGTIVDVTPSRLGFEIVIDIGIPLTALVTSGSVERLDLRPGRKAYASFKATAARFIES
jgi:molybdate/tungstate transport system ATP-binding protein